MFPYSLSLFPYFSLSLFLTSSFSSSSFSFSFPCFLIPESAFRTEIPITIPSLSHAPYSSPKPHEQTEKQAERETDRQTCRGALKFARFTQYFKTESGSRPTYVKSENSKTIAISLLFASFVKENLPFKRFFVTFPTNLAEFFSF